MPTTHSKSLVSDQNAKEYVPKIKKGSVIREYKYGVFVESKVITNVILNERGQLEFTSETKNGHKINYIKSESSLTLMEE
ncbi:hypothetical protein [Photobacterium kishitanii]|uniref:Uncharacterized protein n=1 Tax=Photobacterium kishitanii TaxID=318456 RepID=A0A2T3KL65_9GAMM|nr:hypothetical protein [Photobacterium kishitanii]PSV00431.1 hypothetical protein C9J27_04685 [Photobacterium kishitanii]